MKKVISEEVAQTLNTSAGGGKAQQRCGKAHCFCRGAHKSFLTYVAAFVFGRNLETLDGLRFLEVKVLRRKVQYDAGLWCW